MTEKADMAMEVFIVTDCVVLTLQVLCGCGNGYIMALFCRYKPIRNNRGARLLIYLALTNFLLAVTSLPYVIYLVSLWNPVRLDYDPRMIMISGMPLPIQLKLSLALSIFLAFERLCALYRPVLYRKLNPLIYANVALAVAVTGASIDIFFEFLWSPFDHVINCAAFGCFVSAKFRFYWGNCNTVLGFIMIFMMLFIMIKLRQLSKSSKSVIQISNKEDRRFRKANLTTCSFLTSTLIFITIPSVGVGIFELTGNSIFRLVGPFYIVGILATGVCHSIIFLTQNDDARHFVKKEMFRIDHSHIVTNLSDPASRFTRTNNRTLFQRARFYCIMKVFSFCIALNAVCSLLYFAISDAGVSNGVFNSISMTVNLFTSYLSGLFIFLAGFNRAYTLSFPNNRLFISWRCRVTCAVFVLIAASSTIVVVFWSGLTRRYDESNGIVVNTVSNFFVVNTVNVVFQVIPMMSAFLFLLLFFRLRQQRRMATSGNTIGLIDRAERCSFLQFCSILTFYTTALVAHILLKKQHKSLVCLYIDELVSIVPQIGVAASMGLCNKRMRTALKNVFLIGKSSTVSSNTTTNEMNGLPKAQPHLKSITVSPKPSEATNTSTNCPETQQTASTDEPGSSMGGQCSTNSYSLDKSAYMAQVETNRKIEAEIEKAKANKTLKLLLLGPGESGKSTTIKQIKIIHDSGFSDNERIVRRYGIYLNLLEGLEEIHKTAIANNLQYARTQTYKYASDIKIFLEEIKKSEKYFPQLVCEEISKYLEDPTVISVLNDQAHYHIDDSTLYFVQNLKRITVYDFIPSDEDILRSRVPTSGVVQYSIMLKNFRFSIFDVGGQRAQRRKWLHVFDDVHAILFITSLSEYDQMLREDSTTHRMKESLSLFEKICNGPFFTDTAMILFLNKIDLFELKIQHTNINVCLKSYKGPQTRDDALLYIKQRFLSLNKNRKRTVYDHVTCATDTKQIQVVIDSVIDVVIQNTMQKVGIQ
ncbi:unnamed protein product [Caenorhabditis auriculariae]|uniref:G-protein coupled receptors family 1 profile domain-containing protein n=1 Tax=Caenorhabditis auriculariae TaxID=2777116 RepID=A0A8S1GUP3_9PELO|nr:unnamed protein product [Caenorhabditis auriculariae]